MVGRPFQWFGTGLETLFEVRNWSGDPTGGLELVERPSQSSLTGRETLQRFGTGRETLPKFFNWSGDLPEDRNWSGDPTESLEVDGRSFQSYRSSKKALPEVRNC